MDGRVHSPKEGALVTEIHEQAALYGLPYATPQEQTITQQFVAWIRTDQGKMALNLFTTLSFDAYDSGAKKIGAKAIWERMRWTMVVEKRLGDGYKLNNNFTSRIVRMVVTQHPELSAMFEFRRLRSK